MMQKGWIKRLQKETSSFLILVWPLYPRFSMTLDVGHQEFKETFTSLRRFS